MTRMKKIKKRIRTNIKKLLMFISLDSFIIRSKNIFIYKTFTVYNLKLWKKNLDY